MFKTVVVDENGEIIKLGDWDSNEITIDGQLIALNPMPSNYQVTQLQVRYDSASESWVEVGKPSDKERIRQLEDMLIVVLGVI